MEKASSIRPSPEAKALYFKLLITGARPKWWAFSGAAIANTTGIDRQERCGFGGEEDADKDHQAARE